VCKLAIVTSGELIRAARLRAGLSQAELAERLGMPQSSIARWEVDSVEPGLTKLRDVLQACGFDLSLSLIPFERDPERDARVLEVQRMTPQERMRGMIERRERE
jgi:transcriptional regulator with XRE-family HTH domain